MFSRRLTGGLCTVLVAALMLAGPAQSRVWDEDYFPNYTVVDQNGKEYAFYDDLVRGKIVAVNFIYTTCTDICGLATARMGKLIENIGEERMGKDFFVYSISLTPEIDTPEKLKNYASAFGEVEGWKFLTGDPDEIKDLRWKLGERSRFLWEHRSDMVIGNDADGYWRRISLMGNLANLADEFLRLDPEYRRTVGKVARVGDTRRHVISNRPGESLFQKACSACHTIGGGERVGPDLYGVTWKRDGDWLMRVLTEPAELREEGDPLFTQLDEAYPNVMMPYLDLSKADAEDVLKYLGMASVKVRKTRNRERAEQDAAEAAAAGG